jgi:hypothetical protein
LLEVEGDVLADALIADVADPGGVNGARARSALAAGDRPMNVFEIENG